MIGQSLFKSLLWFENRTCHQALAGWSQRFILSQSLWNVFYTQRVLSDCISWCACSAWPVMAVSKFNMGVTRVEHGRHWQFVHWIKSQVWHKIIQITCSENLIAQVFRLDREIIIILLPVRGFDSITAQKLTQSQPKIQWNRQCLHIHLSIQQLIQGPFIGRVPYWHVVRLHKEGTNVLQHCIKP